MSRRGFAAGLFTQQDTDNTVLPPVIDDTEVLSNVNFFDGFEQWTTPGSDDPEAAWTRNNTRVGLSQATGPAGGAFPQTLTATDGQFYGFVESSGPGTATFFSLESPVINASLGLSVLTFQLFMRFGVGGSITDGTLRVQGWNGSAWSNIGLPIVGSQQADQDDAYLPSINFDDYDSVGFNNTDFRFRLLFERGTDPNDFNYDCAVDNVVISGPNGAVSEPPPPPPNPDPNGIIFTLSGEDGVDSYGDKGLNLNYPNPEQPHNRVNITDNLSPFPGNRHLRTEVRKSDNPSFVDTGPAASKRRAEISGRNGSVLFDLNDEYWLGYALFLPSNPMAVIRGCTVQQLHSFSQETLQVSIFAGSMQFVSDGPGTNQILPGGNVSLAGRNLLNRWFKVRINFRLSTGGAGFIRIWIDNDIEANPTVDYSGRTSPGNSYFKKGTYWWNAGNDNTTSFAQVLHDNIAVGDDTSDFDSVDPALFVRND